MCNFVLPHTRFPAKVQWSDGNTKSEYCYEQTNFGRQPIAFIS